MDTKHTASGTHVSLTRYALHSLPYLLMLALAIAAVAATNTAPSSSFVFWQFLAPIFALICIVSQWSNVGTSARERLVLVRTQVLHWGLIWVFMQALRLPDFQVVMTGDARGIAALLLFALATMMAGIYLNWRFLVVGGFMLAGAITIGFLEQTGLALALLAVAAVVFMLGYYRLSNRMHHASGTQH